MIPDIHYKNWLKSLKHKIKSAQLKAAVTVNTQLLELYWDLGKDIAQKQQEANWGDAILEQLSIDLRLAFPDMKGFSRRNLYAIKQWYSFFSTESEFVPQPVAQIPWGHNRLIVSKIKNTEEALFYCKTTLQNSWSRDQLEIAIKNNYFETKGKSITKITFAKSEAGKPSLETYSFKMPLITTEAQ